MLNDLTINKGILGNWICYFLISVIKYLVTQETKELLWLTLWGIQPITTRKGLWQGQEVVSDSPYTLRKEEANSTTTP